MMVQLHTSDWSTGHWTIERCFLKITEEGGIVTFVIRSIKGFYAQTILSSAAGLPAWKAVAVFISDTAYSAMFRTMTSLIRALSVVESSGGFSRPS